MNRAREEARERITALGKLSAGWDSYGSQPPNHVAIAGSRQLFEESQQRGLPLPQIVPVAGGGIQLEWNLPRKALELEVLPTGAVECLMVDELTGTETEERAPFYTSQDLVEKMLWLL